ncbi:hypothetical protein [Acidithiobacillus sp.]|uniref:hypothetical protein n=1 Tax=Acidithiobacillus sp. TaxID=1872118 RepID=UPI003D03D590
MRGTRCSQASRPRFQAGHAQDGLALNLGRNRRKAQRRCQEQDGTGVFPKGVALLGDHAGDRGHQEAQTGELTHDLADGIGGNPGEAGAEETEGGTDRLPRQFGQGLRQGAAEELLGCLGADGQAGADGS